MRSTALGAIILFAAVALSNGASGSSAAQKKMPDAEITKLLVGKWAEEEDLGNGVKVKGVTHYQKDGKIDAKGAVITSDKELKVDISGTWKVADGMIIATVTKSNIPQIMEGHVTKDEVLSIDEKQFKYKNERGQEKIQKRIKE